MTDYEALIEQSSLFNKTPEDDHSDIAGILKRIGATARPVTKSGHNVFHEDEYGRKFFTYEGWKENQSAAVAWTDLAIEAAKHLGSGFTKGGSMKTLPVRGTEAVLRAVDGWAELGKMAYRGIAKNWRDDEEEAQAAYDNYLKLTNKFYDTYGVSVKDGQIVPYGTEGAELVKPPESFIGDLLRSAGPGTVGEYAAKDFDKMIDPRWADSWSLLLDPAWLIPGGQAGKVSQAVEKGLRGTQLAKHAQKVKSGVNKVAAAPGINQAISFFSKPVTNTAAGSGKFIAGTGKTMETAGELAGTRYGKGVAGAAGAYAAYEGLEGVMDDRDLLQILSAIGAGYATAKAIPQVIGKTGAGVRVVGETIEGTAKGIDLGGAAAAANIGSQYTDATRKLLKTGAVNNPSVQWALSKSASLADLMTKGAMFGAGIGYGLGGKEGAASGIGIGLIGGPIGALQGKAIGLASRVKFQRQDPGGNWVTIEADSVLDIPQRDLVANWMARLPEEDRNSIAARVALEGDNAMQGLYKIAILDTLFKGVIGATGEGDMVTRFMSAEDIGVQFGEQVAGARGAMLPPDDAANPYGKPLVILNLDVAENMAHTFAHEIFHPSWRSIDGDNPLNSIRAELEAEFFGVTDIDGTVIRNGRFTEEQFLKLEDNYLSLMDDGFAESQRLKPMQERRSFVIGEMLSESAGAFIQGAGNRNPVAYARSVLRRAKVDSFTQDMFGFRMTEFQAELLGRMRAGFEKLGIKFDTAGNPVSPIFKDPKSGKINRVKINEDGSQTIIKTGVEDLGNSPEVNNLVAEYLLAREKVLERLNYDSGPDGDVVVTARKAMNESPTTVARMSASGMFKVDGEGKIIYENGSPVLLTRKERLEVEKTRQNAVLAALDQVASGEASGGLVKRELADGSFEMVGTQLSKEQLEALMNIPDDILPRPIKDKIKALNDHMGAGFNNALISYFKALSGSRYTSKASMSQQLVTPFGWRVTAAGNFNLQTFSIGRFEKKLETWWNRRGKNYSEFRELFGGDKEQFRADVIGYLKNQVDGTPNPAGPKKDAIADFLSVARKGVLDELPQRIGGKRDKSVAPISLRVDRMATISGHGGNVFPLNYGNAARNFMPAKKGKGLPPLKGEVSEGYSGKRTLGRVGRATERSQELQELAQNVDQMSQAEWNAAVDRLDPIIPTPDDKIPNPSMFKEMDRSLKALNKDGKPFVLDVSQYKEIRNPAPGSTVKKVRIDISAMERAMEAYRRGDIEAPLHPVAFYDEDGIGYASHLYIKDGTFSYPGNIQDRIVETAQGRSKDTFIFTEGEVIGGPLPSRSELMRVNSKGERVWTEAGVNPLRHGYAYDKNNPSIKIHGGDRMLLANNSVWVRNARKVEAVKVPGLKRMGSGEFEGPEVRFMPAGKGVEVAPGRVRAEEGAEFNLSKPILAQFMPAKKVRLEDYRDRAIFALAADNLAVGNLEVGPTGAKAPIDVPAQGGRGFQFLDPDNMIWAFTDESAAKRLIKRGLDVSGGKNTVIMGVTSQGSTTHFNSAYGLNGFVRNLEAGVESGTFSSKRMNQYVKDLMGLVAKSESKDFTPQQRKIISGIKGLRSLRRAVESKKINFATAGMIKDKFTNIGKMKNSKLEIIQPELVEAGMDLSSLMRDMSDPELRDVKIGDVVALVELNLTKRPRKTDFHYSYPWTVEGKPIGFLKEFHNVRDLTSSTKIYQGVGKAKLKKNIGPQPLQTVMPVFDKLGTYFMPAGKGGDIFYSNTSKALESPKVRNSATGPAMLNDIIRQDPAARQEMKWIDLDRWLMDKKGKVTKEEVQEFIDANQIAVVEKVRGGDESPEIRAAEEAVEDAQREMYDADDRGTYQEARDAEMAFEEAVANLKFVSRDFDPQFDKSDLSLPGAVKGSYRELELMLPKRKGEQFKDSHFETDENVFAHVRFNERIDADGKRMLFIEEVQSDWAAKGKDVGFNEPYINGDIVGGREESVPAAPFVSKRKGNRFVKDDKWRALAMKRMIRWGADNGYDRVGWITGRDSADRYNLNTYVSKIEYMRLPGESQTMISAWDKAGSNVISAKMVPNKDLVGTVGKDLARKIDSDESGMGEFDGLDLAMGGKFHKQFYDIDLPNYTGKYVKKWGGKVGMVDVSLRAAEDVEALKGIPERTTKAHYIDITPKMKADVQQGQAMFMPAGEGRAPRRTGSATSRPARTRIPMGAVAKQLRMERDLKELKRN